MRYITSIADPGDLGLYYKDGTILDEHDGALLYSWLRERAVLSDLSRFLGKGRDIAGVGFNPVTCNHGAVTHTKKTFKLYDHIDAAFMIMNEKPQEFEHCDSFTVTSGVRHFQKRYDTIDIDLGSSRIALFGGGTVVSLITDLFHSRERLFSLYDFLVLMCRQTHLNLMQYNIVQFKSSAINRYVQVWFKHDTDSERFFTKMWLDVIK